MCDARMNRALLFFMLVYCFIIFPDSASAGNFEYRTKSITKSPAIEVSYAVKKGYDVIDYDVSPMAPVVLTILRHGDVYELIEVNFNDASKIASIQAPEADSLNEIELHPNGEDIYALGLSNGKSAVWRGKRNTNPAWTLIYSTDMRIRNLVVNPTLFTLYNEPKTGRRTQHRLYFGVELDNGVYGVKTISENGELPYNAIAPDGLGEIPEVESINVPWAIPFDFHPSGKKLVWQDKNHCFHTASYGYDSWYTTDDIALPEVCVDSIFFTPNGIGLTIWRREASGVEAHFGFTMENRELSKEHKFLMPPLWTADGKGLIGVVSEDEVDKLLYVPVELPLADVSNAWMFIENQKDKDLFEEYGGLFRSTTLDQLYSMYETENYSCGGYSSETPTRPYLVTTDVFWEVFAASFQGLFQLFERHEAMPSFWNFISNADARFHNEKCDDRLCKIFSTLNQLKDISGPITPEMKLILEADGYHDSDVLGGVFEYEDLKPRGHYAQNMELSVYFRALRYLAMINFSDKEAQEFRNMPTDLKQDALSFIKPYLYFIAQSRYELAIDFKGLDKPPYIKHSPQGYRIFPLSWGIDNEILNSTIYHNGWPENEQLGKLLPDSLEIATVAGSSFAKGILADQGIFEAEPNLMSVLEDLEARWKAYSPPEDALYAKWIQALGTQWAEDVMPTDDSVDIDFWRAKRLQTGLASWTTLRHVTVLVNERVSAECGESGFEPIILEPPLGAVEPDPDTFMTIADLFDIEINMVKRYLQFRRLLPSEEYDSDKRLREGIIRRLEESRDHALAYRHMALKQIAGEPLSPEEYEKIFYVGRAAEYNFLLFNSLASDKLGISNPDPVQKVVDIAGGGRLQTPYLHAAVGRPAEWDLIVPHFGRRQIVKGVAYTFHQFTEKEILNDEDWIKVVDDKPPVFWTQPYYSEQRLSCPPKYPF